MNCNRMSALPYRLVFPLMAAMLFIVTGCATWQWTDIEWYNTSDETIYVSAVDGMLPLAHCGYLSPHPVRDSSYRASLSYGDPVTVDSLLTVVWLTDDGATTNSSTFNRDHFGIPPRISGGTVTFCLLKAGEWEIEYSKER